VKYYKMAADQGYSFVKTEKQKAKVKKNQ